MRALLALALLSVGCSLLAPDDDFFVGGGVPSSCEPAPPCGVYPEPDVTVDNAADLLGLVNSATPGKTIGIAPGTYALGGPLEFKVDGVTLRSTTGNAADVVVIGTLPTIVGIYSSDVTIADLTLTGSSRSAVVLSPPLGQLSERMRLCNVTIRDGGEFGVNALEGVGYADCALIENSRLELTSAGSAVACCPGCSPVGVRVAGGRGWVIRNSSFAGFFCQDAAGACTNGQPIALTFLFGCRDTLIENNRIVDVSRGIVLGYTKTDSPTRSYDDAPYGGVAIDHYDGIVRNNLIAGHPVCFDTGIEINRAREPHVLHNTVVHRGVLGYVSIDRRFPETFARIENNLVLGRLGVRECGQQDCTGLL
ncbi:MAG TPA: hypothetical protein VFB62_06440, partial [Polyangiaceae bacterium]|nr:hypothetical protein [Polyangiaceae bacterium]